MTSSSLELGSKVARGDGVDDVNGSLGEGVSWEGDGVEGVVASGSGVDGDSSSVGVCGVSGRGVCDDEGGSNRVGVGRLVNRGVSGVDSDIVLGGVRGVVGEGVDEVNDSSVGVEVGRVGVDGLGVEDSTSGVCVFDNEGGVVGVEADSAVGVRGVDSTLVGGAEDCSESLDGSASDVGGASEPVTESDVSGLRLGEGSEVVEPGSLPVEGESLVVGEGVSGVDGDSGVVGAVCDDSVGVVGNKVPVDGVARGKDWFESGDAKFVVIFFFYLGQYWGLWLCAGNGTAVVNPMKFER